MNTHSVSSRPHLEILEARIAPSTLLGLNDSDQLIRFNSATPGTIAATVNIGGLGASEDVVAIDVRPATGVLYGLGLDGIMARLLTIDPVTGATAQIGSTFGIGGTAVGFDFDPTTDLLRVVTDGDQNLFVNPNTGSPTAQALLNPGSPNVVAAAYTNPWPGTGSTTLYVIDSGTDRLATLDTTTGTLTDVGTGLGVDTSAVAGFDLGHGRGESFAALRVGGVSKLYSINLTAGTASDLGSIGTGTPEIRGLAVLLHTWDGSANSSVSNAANWVAGITPVAGDSLLFPDVPTAREVSSAGIVFNDLRFTGADYEYFSGSAKLQGGIFAHGAGTVTLNGIDLRGSDPGLDTIFAGAGATIDFQTIAVDANSGRGVEFQGAGMINITSLTASGSAVPVVVNGPDLLVSGYTAGGGTTVLSGSVTVVDDFSNVTLQGGTLRAAYDPTGKTTVGRIVTGAITATGGTLESGIASLDVDGNLSLNAATTALFKQPASIGLQSLLVEGTVSLGNAVLSVDLAGPAPARLTLIENDGTTDAVIGTFAGLAEGASLSLGGETYSITYAGGDGNDVVLTKTSGPLVTISGSTATYTDVDGDAVTVKISKGILGTSNFILRDTDGIAGSRAQLELIDLANDDTFNGASITITARRTAGAGDGSVNVGFIDATRVDLSAVSIAGDLGGLDAGDPNVAGGMKSLTVQSLGVFGLATGAPNLRSNLDGPLDKLTVRGDVRDADLSVLDSKFTSVADYDGRIGTIMIGGSLQGGPIPFSGDIRSGSDIGTLTILGDLRGGTGAFSGIIETGDLGSATIGGSIVGGTQNFAGSIFIFGTAKSIKVGHNIVGGSSGDTGQIEVREAVGSITIGGSLIGGTGFNSAELDLTGTLGSLSIGGSVLGGPGLESAHITADQVKTISIKGSVIGDGVDSATISIDDGIGSLTIGGSVIGGGERGSAFLEFGGDFSGQEPVGAIKIGGAFLGGAGESTARLNVNGELKSLSVGAGWQGGAGDFSARFVGNKVGAITIGGSFAGGVGDQSAQFDLDAVGKIQIGGDFAGGPGQQSGYLEVDSLASLSIARSVFSGAGAGSGRIEVAGHLDAMSVGGGIHGTAANPMLLMVGAVSNPIKGADLALGKLTVKGSVEQLRILAGFGTLFSTTVGGLNADAQIGSVSIGGDWMASSISAGVQDDATSTFNSTFGNADDRKIQGGGTTDTAELRSRIASIAIKGQAFGTATAGDHFGFVAQEIGALTIGKVKVPLTATQPDDPTATDPLFLLGATGDLRVHEVAL